MVSLYLGFNFVHDCVKFINRLRIFCDMFDETMRRFEYFLLIESVQEKEVLFVFLIKFIFVGSNNHDSFGK